MPGKNWCLWLAALHSPGGGRKGKRSKGERGWEQGDEMREQGDEMREQGDGMMEQGEKMREQGEKMREGEIKTYLICLFNC